MLTNYRDKLKFSSKEHGDIHSETTLLSSAENSHRLKATGPFGTIEIYAMENEDYAVWKCNYELISATILSSKVNESYLGLHFMLKNDFHFTLKGLPSITLLEHQYNLAYIPAFECEHVFQADSYTAFGIRISPEFLGRWSESFDSISTFLNAVDKKMPARFSDIPMAVNPEITAIILNLVHCPYTGPLKKMYLDFKIPELLFLSLQRISSSHPRIRLRQDDLKKIQEVRNFIIENLGSPGTILDLAHEVGMNDFKLKAGFKQVYGTTIFGFVLEERMRTAWVRLTETELSVKNIAGLTGYSNVSGFSVAFKRRFGYPPSALRKGSIRGTEKD